MKYYLLIKLILLDGNLDYIEIKFKTLQECNEYKQVISSTINTKTTCRKLGE